ncbi:MAG: hypothetical protein ACQERS_10420 [Bacteroidota bacterium]
MKKLVLFLVIIVTGTIAAAQVNSYALGVRVYGGDNFNGAELSFQKGLNEKNRLELDASFGYGGDINRLALIGMYHWNWNLLGRFNWYLGPGASLAIDNYDNTSTINIGLGGQIGIEYDFKDLPILVSLDSRPIWDFLGEVNGLGWGGALGLRFTW